MKVSIAEVLQTIEIDLWGHEYETVWVTKSTIDKAQALWTDAIAEGREGGDRDLMIDKLGQLLDLRLKTDDAKAPKPSKLLRDKWDADEVAVDHVIGLLNTIGGPT